MPSSEITQLCVSRKSSNGEFTPRSQKSSKLPGKFKAPSPRASAFFEESKYLSLSARGSAPAASASRHIQPIGGNKGSSGSRSCGGGPRWPRINPDPQLPDVPVKIISTKKKKTTTARHDVTLSMGSAPIQRRSFVPRLIVSEGTL
ncbi:hypothetical protein TNCV_3479821 [Trichonephila clavipes]|nr:hypothetical protein TNCV_3479821 [Trichonephila clavipes]